MKMIIFDRQLTDVGKSCMFTMSCGCDSLGLGCLNAAVLQCSNAPGILRIRLRFLGMRLLRLVPDCPRVFKSAPRVAQEWPKNVHKSSSRVAQKCPRVVQKGPGSGQFRSAREWTRVPKRTQECLRVLLSTKGASVSRVPLYQWVPVHQGCTSIKGASPWRVPLYQGCLSIKCFRISIKGAFLSRVPLYQGCLSSKGGSLSRMPLYRGCLSSKVQGCLYIKGVSL